MEYLKHACFSTFHAWWWKLLSFMFHAYFMHESYVHTCFSIFHAWKLLSCMPYSKWSTWNMHVSGMFQHTSCDYNQWFSCMKFPVTIMKSLLFHAWTMHDSWNMHGIWWISCMRHACFKPYSMRGTGVFHSWYRPIPCVIQAYSMRGTGIFHAWYRHIPCMVQAYSMHGTGIFHAWYRRIPCMVLAYSMCGTGVCVPCMVQVFPCMHHVQYRQLHHIISILIDFALGIPYWL